MVTVQTATETDYLKAHASNTWFVLGAYFFAFFPWAIMNNIDFISEKWRTCRRTRKLARIHLASSIFPIIYVAVYAEAQRRDGDSKELGAALAALMFNVFQLMRTVMGWVQLNAFVAWCKDAAECIRALEGDEYRGPRSESREERSRNERRGMMEMVGQWKKVFVSWCKRVLQRICVRLWREGENGLERRNGDIESSEGSVTVRVEGNEVDGAERSMSGSTGIHEESRDAEVSVGSNAEVSGETAESSAESGESGFESNVQCCMSRRKGDDGNEIEEVIMVNNMVVDNELGGREVTVLPSWEKMWRGMKEGGLTPSKWLRTDRAILNTVRWGGAYLCGTGEGWSVDRYGICEAKKSVEKLETFFSREMEDVRRILQSVEWDVNEENDGRELFSIRGLGDSEDMVELSGEMSAAYGTRNTSYGVSEPSDVRAYSFEFNSLVGSYPTRDKQVRKTGNREKIGVELVHSMLVAKHMGVEKLKAIRRYYDRYCLDWSTFRNAFKLLLKQTDSRISDDSKTWRMFESSYDIPIFPYRMQMTALWDEATNWRVLQASAHRDIFNSNYFALVATLWIQLDVLIELEAPLPVSRFDQCAKRAIELFDGGLFGGGKHWGLKGSVGVVMETVRTFLAEWITANAQEPNWEPDMPTASIEFNAIEISVDTKAGLDKMHYITWICQRELQRKIAKMSKEKENIPGSAALIMLFILGFPLLRMAVVEDSEVEGRDGQDGVREASASSFSNTHRNIDLGVEVWRARTALAPQDISLIIRIDKTNGTVSLRLENNRGDTRFVWQDWVDAAMGYLKGVEEAVNGDMGYGRKIVRAELWKPMVELCPLRVEGRGIEEKVKKTGTARVWMGWPAFDMRICKFEVDQWFDACGLDIRQHWGHTKAIKWIEEVMEAEVSAESEEVEKSTDSTDV